MNFIRTLQWENIVYRPLPKSLTIKESLIDGLGLFSTENISSGTELGTSHISDTRFEDGYIRTPLGGFVNHSDESNCEFIKEKIFPNITQKGTRIYLKTIKDISVDEELVAKYWLYDV